MVQSGMAHEDTLDDKTLNELLAATEAADITPEHRAWMNKQIEKTLAKIEDGSMTFTSIDDLARKFGLDAR